MKYVKYGDPYDIELKVTKTTFKASPGPLRPRITLIQKFIIFLRFGLHYRRAARTFGNIRAYRPVWEDGWKKNSPSKHGHGPKIIIPRPIVVICKAVEIPKDV